MKSSEIILTSVKERYYYQMCKCLNDKVLVETYPISQPFNIEDIESYIGSQKYNHRRSSFAILYNKKFVGLCSLYLIDQLRKEAEVDYWIAPSYWNLGIASQALAHLVHHSQKNLSLKILSTEVLKKNIGSIRVLEKNGFTRMYTHNSHLCFPEQEVIKMQRILK